jgi:putative transposase
MWNRVAPEVQEQIVEMALEQSELFPLELAVRFTYFKIIGGGWMYLSTVLDDFSRHFIDWKLCITMRADDVTDTLDMALQASGCDCAAVVHKHRLPSDNGSSTSQVNSPLNINS